MQAITLEVILRAVFGVTDPVRSERLRERLPQLLAETSSLSLQFRVLLPSAYGRGDPLERLRGVSREVDELLAAEITERRADRSCSERQDILSLLVQARFQDGGAMSDQELRDQLITLLLAGHETTATALAWTFDLLLRNLQTLERLTTEVDEGGDEYLRAVVSESLRLRPVVPLAGRRLACDLNVDGFSLPAGTDVSPAIWLTHTRADIYPDPFAFRPERFLESPPTTYGWIPFGGGIRRCLGAAFAEFEMRAVIETVLSRRLLEPASSRAEHVTRRNVTFSPRHGTRVRSFKRVDWENAASGGRRRRWGAGGRLAQATWPARASGSTGAEASRLIGAARGIARAVGVRAGAGQLAAVHDQVFLADRAACRTSTRGSRACRLRSGPGQTGWCPRCGASCRGGASCATGGPWARAVETTRRLHIRRAARSGRPHDRVAIADLAARRVDEIGAGLHLGDQLLVEQAFGLGVQRGVDRDDVADLTSDSTWWKVTPSSCSTSGASRWRSV